MYIIAAYLSMNLFYCFGNLFSHSKLNFNVCKMAIDQLSSVQYKQGKYC